MEVTKVILPNEEWRTIEYTCTNDSVLLIAKSAPISVIISWPIITLSNDKVSQSMTNRLTNKVERIRLLDSRWMSNQSEWTNEWMNIVHQEPFTHAHATLFRGHELSIINLHFIWQLYPCWYWLYLILSEVSQYADENIVRNHACLRDRATRTNENFA